MRLRVSLCFLMDGMGYLIMLNSINKQYSLSSHIRPRTNRGPLAAPRRANENPTLETEGETASHIIHSSCLLQTTHIQSLI